MKLSIGLLVAIILSAAGCATAPDSGPKTLSGHFSYLDSSQPGCGVVAWASKATFVIEGSGKKIKLAVPCIEMQFVEDGAGVQGPLKVGERYKIVVVGERPVPDMSSPYVLNKSPWYLSSASL